MFKIDDYVSWNICLAGTQPLAISNEKRDDPRLFNKDILVVQN